MSITIKILITPGCVNTSFSHLTPNSIMVDGIRSVRLMFLSALSAFFSKALGAASYHSSAGSGRRFCATHQSLPPADCHCTLAGFRKRAGDERLSRKSGCCHQFRDARQTRPSPMVQFLPLWSIRQIPAQPAICVFSPISTLCDFI